MQPLLSLLLCRRSSKRKEYLKQKRSKNSHSHSNNNHNNSLTSPLKEIQVPPLKDVTAPVINTCTSTSSDDLTIMKMEIQAQHLMMNEHKFQQRVTSSSSSSSSPSYEYAYEQIESVSPENDHNDHENDPACDDLRKTIQTTNTKTANTDATCTNNNNTNHQETDQDRPRQQFALHKSLSLLKGQFNDNDNTSNSDDEDDVEVDEQVDDMDYNNNNNNVDNDIHDIIDMVPGLSTLNSNDSSWYDLDHQGPGQTQGTQESDHTDKTMNDHDDAHIIETQEDPSWFDLPLAPSDETVDDDDDLSNDAISNDTSNETDESENTSITSYASSSLSTVEHYIHLEKRRSIRFHPTMVTEVRTRPKTCHTEKSTLFFSGHELQKIRDDDRKNGEDGSCRALSKVVLCSAMTLDEVGDSDDSDSDSDDSDMDIDIDIDGDINIGINIDNDIDEGNKENDSHNE